MRPVLSFSELRARSAIALASLLCAGCASVATVREDAERTFREHNRVSTEVMLVLPELDPGDAATAELVAADRDMLSACAPLNAMAIARRDQRRIGPLQRLRLPSTIAECRDTTAATLALLNALD